MTIAYAPMPKALPCQIDRFSLSGETSSIAFANISQIDDQHVICGICLEFAKSMTLRHFLAHCCNEKLDKARHGRYTCNTSKFLR